MFKHQRIFVVSKTTSNIIVISRAALRHSTDFPDRVEWMWQAYRCCSEGCHRSRGRRSYHYCIIWASVGTAFLLVAILRVPVHCGSLQPLSLFLQSRYQQRLTCIVEREASVKGAPAWKLYVFKLTLCHSACVWNVIKCSNSCMQYICVYSQFVNMVDTIVYSVSMASLCVPSKSDVIKLPVIQLALQLVKLLHVWGLSWSLVNFSCQTKYQSVLLVFCERYARETLTNMPRRPGNEVKLTRVIEYLFIISGFPKIFELSPTIIEAFRNPQMLLSFISGFFSFHCLLLSLPNLSSFTVRTHENQCLCVLLVL